ncbi:hypothetical protein EMA8858_01715 [Emticicia aquatica]|uniref:T9SS type A sorting domain-containing protein n=1 Tax=Emticicia aquatica TaxID=1681835 RepID=A0ABM9AP45_9BACT|nr:sialate O-acetylesterase [Emticicia aquatica]CAH0995592.1 hypothetical protein EMA8858_01715 [Emticicia aquatica]
MNYFRNGLILLMSTILFECYSQIQITFPVSRIVFQRNNQNQANVTIAGSYFQQLDRIEMRAVPVNEGQGTETGWNDAQEFHNNGIFSGTMLLTGGWYNIEVRGYSNGIVATTSTLERVGVGEVFIVAGQSNAQGDAVYSGGHIGATEDRVSTINYYEPLLNEDNLPFQFSQMANNTKMSPYNYVPWFWAKLGDRLVQRLNVPVLFYGASLGGISCDVWRRSVEGQDLRQEFPLFIKVPGMPYRSMKATLQHYVTRTGVRAILWQQGESDGEYSSETYYNNLKTVIEKTRSDARKGDLAWVVARSSRNPLILNNVIAGQNFTIQRVPNVFAGPTTDEIVGANFRADGIHFHNDGLNAAADFWSFSLNNEFFANSQPLQARSLPSVNIACNPNNTTNKFTITTGGYPFYKWSNGGTSNVITVSNGTFSFKAIDDAGNTVFSQPFTISTNNNVSQPSITASGNTSFCDGETIKLTSNINGGNVWNNGERGQSIVVRNSGNYSVVNYSLNGCQSPSSSVINIDVKQSPLNIIQSSKVLPICPDETLELFSSNTDVVSYRWNTNETSQKIVVQNSGSYSLTLKGNNGCESQSFFDVTFRNRPTTSIISDGPTSFCLGRSVNLSANGVFQSYIWSNGLTENKIKVTETGTYSLKVKDNFGCFSETISKNIVVNALPAIKIQATDVDKFCEGNVVTLSTDFDSAVAYKWSTGESTKVVKIEKEGIYSLKIKDKNGCESIPDTIKLSYIPSPLASISTIDNINTICEGETIVLNANSSLNYLWNDGSVSKELSVSKAGTYSLKIKDEKNCESKPVFFDVFVKNSPQKPSINIDGAFQLEAIPASSLPGQYFNWKKDEQLLSTVSSFYKASESGNFSVRTVLKYSVPNNKELICYSPFSNITNLFIPYLDKGLRVYPNPNTSGIFTIETIKDNPESIVSVYTLAGKVLFTGKITDFKEKRIVDLRMLESGTYIIRVSSGSFSESARVNLKY